MCWRKDRGRGEIDFLSRPALPGSSPRIESQATDIEGSDQMLFRILLSNGLNVLNRPLSGYSHLSRISWRAQNGTLSIPIFIAVTICHAFELLCLEVLNLLQLSNKLHQIWDESLCWRSWNTQRFQRVFQTNPCEIALQRNRETSNNVKNRRNYLLLLLLPFWKHQIGPSVWRAIHLHL